MKQNDPRTPPEAIREAARRMGGQVALANSLGLIQPTIAQWIRRRRVPPEHVLRVEFLTGVSRHELNPVIYPPPIVADLVSIEPEATTTEGAP